MTMPPFAPDTTDLTRRYPVPGFTLAWDSWGDGPGPPLVLVHGYTGSAHDFALHVETLARDRRVFALDHRGHGRSSHSGREESYTVDHLVDDLVAWLSDEVVPEGGPVDLLGHSMGGRVAIRLALTRRDLLRSLVLMDTTAWAFGDDRADFRRAATAFLSGIEAGQTPPRTPPGPEEEMVAATVPRAWIERKWQLRDGMDPMAQRALGFQLFDDRLEPVDHRLGDIECPTTVVVGALDEPYASHAPRLAAAIPDATLVVIDGAHHSPQLTHPQQWLDAVRGHLGRAGSAPGPAPSPG